MPPHERQVSCWVGLASLHVRSAHRWAHQGCPASCQRSCTSPAPVARARDRCLVRYDGPDPYQALAAVFVAKAHVDHYRGVGALRCGPTGSSAALLPGLGEASRFRASTLTDPYRVVIDVRP